MRRSDDPGLDLRAMLAALGVEETGDQTVDPARLAEFREARDYWIDRFAPMLDIAEPSAPPEALWQRIAADTVQRSQSAAVSRTAEPSWLAGLWESLTLWRMATAAALVAAALIAFVMLPARQAGPTATLVAVLQSPEEARPGFLVEVAADRTIRLTPLGDTPVPAGRALQFWTKADTDQGPTSLGLVSGNSVSRAAYPSGTLGPGQLFEVTLEPETGSPLARPSGPILFVGRAVAPKDSQDL